MNQNAKGFKNSPAVFQRLMDTILKEDIGKRCVVYVDDILIYSKTLEQHEKDVDEIIKRLINAGLRANKEKCEFRVTEIEFIGHRICKDQIRPM